MKTVRLIGGPAHGRNLELHDDAHGINIPRLMDGRFVPHVYREKDIDSLEFVFDPEGVPRWFEENDPLTLAADAVIRKAMGNA